MTPLRERVRVAPLVGVALAAVGFALSAPAGIGLAAVLAASVVLPWPLPFALGQVAAAVAFDGVALSTPFVLVQAGLWLALALAAGVGERDGTRYPAAAAFATVLGASVVGGVTAWASVDALTGAVAAATAIAVVLYGVHRYEQVTVGLVES